MYMIIEIVDSEGQRVKERLDLSAHWDKFKVWTILIIVKGVFFGKSIPED